MRSLNDAETLFQFVKKLREGVYITTATGDILDCNPAFWQMFGVGSLEELRGYKAGTLVKDPSKREEELRILEREGTVREFELTIRLPDGQERIVLDTAYRLEDPETGEILYHGILIDISERKRLEAQLRERAVRDPLTGCYNRHYLAEISREYEKRTESWGVIVADVDNFKTFNDLHGHDYGDRILVQVGRFLSREVRAEDPVFRTGGDEFAIFLPGLDVNGTQEIIHRYRKQFGHSAPVSISLGWAARENMEQVEETIRRADQHLIQTRLRERGEIARR